MKSTSCFAMFMLLFSSKIHPTFIYSPLDDLFTRLKVSELCGNFVIIILYWRKLLLFLVVQTVIDLKRFKELYSVKFTFSSLHKMSMIIMLMLIA